MSNRAHGAAALLAAMVATAACGACDKTTKVGPDTPTAAATTGSGATPAAPPVAPPAAAAAGKLARSSNAFGFELYAKGKGAPGNLAMSPASISAALAMTYGGARGTTEEEMRKVLHLEGPREGVMADWGQLARSLQDPRRPLTLRIANRLFGDKGYTFEQPYLEATKNAYGAPLEPVDFQKAHEPARARINAWVEDQTEKRIKDLLPPGALDDKTRLVLVNAIYFLSDWAEQFDKQATFDQPFHVSAATERKAPMMHRTGDYRAAKADGVTVLELPYKGGDAAMIVVLPDQVDGLAAIEQSLADARLEAWTASLAKQSVSVALPRFEVSPTPSMALAEKLISLGMPSAFDRKLADFSAIANPTDPRERLRISQVFHKAFVKVDEKGTEAAAATAVVMAGGGGAPPKALEFRADHPFLFFIVDKPSGIVLFIGRVSDPTVP